MGTRPSAQHVSCQLETAVGVSRVQLISCEFVVGETATLVSSGGCSGVYRAELHSSECAVNEKATLVSAGDCSGEVQGTTA